MAKRSFQIHPQLLWDVINKQAGHLWKAVLEGVMNSVDAGARSCQVTVDRSRVTIEDDGRGFRDMEEIESFFETFGTPREVESHYGRFRMGRGQLFSFGVNEWRSSNFRMHVDLKPQEGSVATNGLSYKLTETEEKVAGCNIAIDLYDKLVPSEVAELVRDVAKAVAWAPIPVSINGKVVSKDPSGAKWDVVTPDAYVSFKATNSIDVYNLGVFVGSVSAYEYGTGGVVVSREKLDVNFARNAVQSKCPVWKRIRRQFDDRVKMTKTKVKLTDAERAHAITRYLAGSLADDEFAAMPVFETVVGDKVSLSRLEGRIRTGMVAVAPLRHASGARLHETKRACVLTPACVEMFGVDTATEVIEMLARRIASGRVAWKFYRLLEAAKPGQLREIPVEKLADLIPNDITMIDEDDLKPAERAALEILRKGVDKIGQLIAEARRDDEATGRTAARWPSDLLQILERSPLHHRVVRVGRCETADAWTDGMSYIGFERRTLALVNEGRSGLDRLAGLALHEWLHQEPSTATHVHDETFYRMYHDITIDTPVLGAAVDRMIGHGITLARSNSKRLRGAFVKAADAAAYAEDRGTLALIEAAE